MVRSGTVRGCLAMILVLTGLLVGLPAAASDVQTASCTTALLVIDVQHIWLRGLLFTVDTTPITGCIARPAAADDEPRMHMLLLVNG